MKLERDHEPQLPIDWRPSSPEDFLDQNKESLLRLFTLWDQADKYILYSSNDLIGDHYLVPASGWAEVLPAQRYTISIPVSNASGLLRCRMPFDPSEYQGSSHGLLIDHPELHPPTTEHVPFPFSAVSKSYGFARLDFLKNLQFARKVSERWVSALFAVTYFDDEISMSKNMLAAFQSGEPFFVPGSDPLLNSYPVEHLEEAFNLIAFLLYPKWETEQKKWVSRVDDLVAFGVAPPELSSDMGAGDNLRYWLRRAEIHKPRKRTRKVR